MILLQHTDIRSSFENNIHIVGHNFNVNLYKRLCECISRYALNHIVDEFDRVKFIGVNTLCCGCIVRCTHGVPCACELVRYALGSIPLHTIHIYWTMLSFNDMGFNNQHEELFVQQESLT
ncbi:hypothetical protein HKD37_16G045424 [Glycine soja]